MTPNELKTARKALGLSQREMGLELEVDPRTVRRWEAGPQAVPGPVKVAVERGKTITQLAEVFVRAMGALESITDRFEYCLEATHATRADRMESREARAAIALTKKDPPA